MSERLTIVGVGTMGRSIALAAALSKLKVTLVSRRGRRSYSDFLGFCERERKKGRISADEMYLRSYVSWSESLREGVEDADFVIEAREEDENVKKELFKRLDMLCPSDVVLSSNTSSLSITDISSVTEHQERIIGIHFFNPAHIMRLVEVIPSQKTSKETLEKSLNLAHRLGKEPVVVKDFPGFIVNRVLFTMINESSYCLMDGLADAGTIDKALELGANLPMGPLKLADYMGVDVCLNILQNLYKRTKKDKYKPCPILDELVQKGYLGRKTGKGIYDLQSSKYSVINSET